MTIPSTNSEKPESSQTPETASVAKGSTTDTRQQKQQSSGSNEIEQNAMSAADALNLSLLQSDQERKLATLQSNHDKVTETCNKQQNQISELQTKIAELQTSILEKDEVIKIEKESKGELEKRLTKSEEMEKAANQRMVRIEVEGDSLRQEISRLSTTNTSLNTQLSELAAKSNLSTSSSAPLQYEIARLKSELEALNSHSKWLETELSTRTSQSSSLKSTHAKIVQDLTQKFNESTANEEKAKSDLSLLKLRLKSNTQRMENLEKQILEKDKYHADIIHELKVEIQTERNLVALKKENIMRVEDRYNDAVREIDTMKALAAAAKKDHEEEIVAIKGEIENHVGKALEENNAENEKKIKEIRNEMEKIVVEKVKLEDMMMSSGSQGTLAIGDGTGNTRQQPSLLTYGKAEGGNSGDVTGSEPISLIKLYDKLADKEQELRRETAERRKVELYLERIHQDFERRMPKQQQQRREYELAMSQMGDMQNRIQDALQEAQMARDELNQKERESRQTDVECQELRLENSDLAKQVQLLLKKSMGNGDLAGEIQAQNQQLLKEHHRSSARVNELEQKLESDSVQLKLREALSSLKDLEEERENQATLVASIVQQRDLYRALLAKNDTQILAAAGDQGSTAIVAAKDQIERYTEVESKNRELADTISKLNADLLSATNAKQGLEERLQRLDVHATDLSQNTNKLQNELLVAHAATARSQAEASFQLQKVTRLEDSLESSRNDLNRINENRKELQRLNGELQSIIAERENAQVKIEENLRQTEVQLRLSEAKAQSLQAAESRLNTENNSLRSELSRHIALQESMQKLEVGLSAQSSEERDRLVEEVKRLTNELTTTKNQSSLEIEKLQNQLDNANTKVEEIRKIQQESLEEVIKAKNDAMNAQSELQQMTDKHALVEKNLNAAKIKLGDIDVDLSEQDKVETLTAEVNRLKEELIAANKKAEDYQKMTKASEVTLAESTNASLEYKKNTENELKKVREELESAKRNATAKQEALEGLAQDISKSRGEQEKATDGLKVKVETLKAEIATAKSDRDSWKSQVDELSKEIQVHQADVKAAKNNYERELALHAEARKELQAARETIATESSLRQSAELQLENMTVEKTKQDNSLNDNKKQMEQSLKDLETKLEESGKQNEILHNQLATMGEKLDKIQADKITLASQNETIENDVQASDEVALLRKQIADLREVINYMRSEREISETQLQSARLSAERERASGEITKKSLEDARNEFDALQRKITEGSVGTIEESNNLLTESKTKLKQAEEQLMLLRDSNKLFREENEKLENKIQILQEESINAKNAVKPSDEKCRELEVDKVALEAEKASLMREVDVWKERVTSLVSKFHQIDPEEHKQALAAAEESKKECIKLKNMKEDAERQTNSAKNMILRLNKEVMKLKSISEMNKTALEKTKKELAVLQNKKASAASEKEINSLKDAHKIATQELTSAKVRVDNLSEILKKHKAKHRMLQMKIQEAEAKEQEVQSALANEKESHQAVLKAHESLKLIVKEMRDSKDSKVILPKQSLGAPSENPSAPVQTSQTKIPGTAATATMEEMSCDKSVPPIPKIPVGGFKFAPSDSQKLKKVNENETKYTDTSKVGKEPPEEKGETSPKTGMGKVPGSSLTKSAPKESSSSIVKTSALKSQDPVSKKESLSTTKKETKEGSTSKNKKSTLSSAQENKNIAVSSTGLGKSGVAPLVSTDSSTSTLLSVAKPAADSKVTLGQNKSGGSGGNTPTIKTEENSLREKLMKRKRELAKKIEAKNASKKIAVSSNLDTPTAVPVPKKTVVSPLAGSVKAPAESKAVPTSNSLTSITESVSAPESGQKVSNKSLTETNPTKPVAKGKVVVDASESKVDGKQSESKLTLVAESQPVKGSITAGIPSKDGTKKDNTTTSKGVFGSGTSSLVFGSGKTPVFGSGLSASAKPFTATFGGSSGKVDSASGAGAFLNLKPPGSSAAKLVFGSSTNIQLPTPSKIPSTPSIFGNPFGSSNVFGTKKRALEPDDDSNKDASSKKHIRVTDGSGSNDEIVGNETNKNVEKLTDDTSKTEDKDKK